MQNFSFVTVNRPSIIDIYLLLKIISVFIIHYFFGKEYKLFTKFKLAVFDFPFISKPNVPCSPLPAFVGVVSVSDVAAFFSGLSSPHSAVSAVDFFSACCIAAFCCQFVNFILKIHWKCNHITAFEARAVIHALFYGFCFDFCCKIVSVSYFRQFFPIGQAPILTFPQQGRNALNLAPAPSL